MDQPANDGQYHYRNQELGFSVVFPAEFIYYQTQRVNKSGYIDMEYYVPTNDVDYPQDVPSYAKPVVIRVFDRPDWTDYSATLSDMDEFQKLGEKGSRAYFIKFWNEVPADWSDRWNDTLKQEIADSFKIL